MGISEIINNNDVHSIIYHFNIFVATLLTQKRDIRLATTREADKSRGVMNAGDLLASRTRHIPTPEHTNIFNNRDVSLQEICQKKKKDPVVIAGKRNESKVVVFKEHYFEQIFHLLISTWNGMHDFD